MKNLIYNNIDWDKLAESVKNQSQISVGRPKFSVSTGCLQVPVTCNFVVPWLSKKKIEALLTGAIEGSKSVLLDVSVCNIVQNPGEAVKEYCHYLLDDIRLDNPLLAETVISEEMTVEGKSLKMPVVSRFSQKQLEQDWARLLEKKIRKELGFECNLEFPFHEDASKQMKAAFEENRQKDIDLHVEKQIQRAKTLREEKADQEVAPAPLTNEGPKRWRKKNNINVPADGNVLVGGSHIEGKVWQLNELRPESGQVIIEGILFNIETRNIRSDTKLVGLMITDKKTSAYAKGFFLNEKWDELSSLLKIGDYIRIKGETEFDTFKNCLSIKILGVERAKMKQREDNYHGQKRVELHAHTLMSAMDGLNDVSNLVKTAARWGQSAVAITDHGVVQSFPDAAKTAKKLASDKDNPINIKIIYGMEGYLFDDRDCLREDGTIDHKKKNTNHVILLAATQEGLKNIYKLVSISHLNYFYKKPRLPKSVIEAHREGIIIGSACEAGEVFRAVYENKSQEELEEIASFYDYLEIQPIINNRFMIEKGMVDDEEDLRALNLKVLQLGKKLGKPVVATTDAHYDEPESAIYRNILMAGMGFKDAENGQGLYMRTTEEMLEEFAYLGEDAYKVVVENTNLIADKISGDILPVPKGKFPPRIKGAEETLRKTCMEKAYGIYGNPLPEKIGQRLDKELNSIIDNGYAVMYVSAQMLVNKSLEDGYLVGSRGSVGSSFAATMAGITEVNPLDPHYICPNCKHLEWGDMNLYDCGIDMPVKECPECGAVMNRDGFTIPFATFLGFEGDKEPDIDLNFAGEYQSTAHKYVGEIFGEENVYKAGTVSTVAEKTAAGYVRKFHETLEKSIDYFELERLSKGCTGVKKTTGQHPGGIIIVPDDHEIYEFCPVQHPANDSSTGIVTTHFDYHKIDENLLKLDILGHNVPSMIRQLQDMTGVDPLKVDLTDRTVLSIFNGIEALNIKDENYQFTHGSYAIPEFGTSFVRQMLDDTKPDKFADLVRISGFSHGTDVWLNNAQDYIKSGVATMREVISTRDDIMNYLILKGIENKMAFQIMEDVRKNRPLKDQQLKVMKEHGVPDWYIDSCIKIQYMFPRAHAVAYVMMSFRLAWYKVYYPSEFYATHFTSTVADFDAATILKGSRACLDRIEEIKAMDKDAPQKEKDRLLVLEVAYEMYSRGINFQLPSLEDSHSTKFRVKDGAVVLPFVAIPGVGETAANALYEENKAQPFGTVEEAVKKAKLNKTALAGLREYGIFDGLPEKDQLSFISFVG